MGWDYFLYCIFANRLRIPLRVGNANDGEICRNKSKNVWDKSRTRRHSSWDTYCTSFVFLWMFSVAVSHILLFCKTYRHPSYLFAAAFCIIFDPAQTRRAFFISSSVLVFKTRFVHISIRTGKRQAYFARNAGKQTVDRGISGKAPRRFSRNRVMHARAV